MQVKCQPPFAIICATPPAQVAGPSHVAVEDHARGRKGPVYADAVEKVDVGREGENTHVRMSAFQPVAQAARYKGLFHQGVRGVCPRPPFILHRGCRLPHGPAAWNLVHVGHQDKIIRAATGQAAQDGVALKPLDGPRVSGIRRIVHDDVNDLVVKGGVPRSVFGIVEGLGLVGVRTRGLDKHECIYNRVQFVQADVEQVELVEEQERVVNHRVTICSRGYAEKVVTQKVKRCRR